jgi:hypothetical protein
MLAVGGLALAAGLGLASMTHLTDAVSQREAAMLGPAHQFASPGLPGASAATSCQAQVTGLLRDELGRVAGGVPDAEFGAHQTPGRLSLIAYETVLSTATQDLLDTYARNVDALVVAYAPRIERACAAAAEG